MKQLDELHILQCLELAGNGKRLVAPNPMVGSVIVHKGEIVGSGFHEGPGSAHAERMAINNVQDKKLLPASTLYVNLEPCSHHGRTPPCSDFIIENKIRRVVYGCRDISEKVNGKGEAKLLQAGVEVHSAVLEKECQFLNRRFLTFHGKKRPYIILKWAETADKFLAKEDYQSKWISSEQARAMVHEWRAQEAALMVGTNTAIHDNPLLTVRSSSLKPEDFRAPLRICIDRNLSIPSSHHLLNQKQNTLIFCEQKNSKIDNLEYQAVNFSNNNIKQILQALHARNILSVMIEGGAALLNSFITANLWDEARVFTAPLKFEKGIKAPNLDIAAHQSISIGTDTLSTYFNCDYRGLL